MIVADTDNGIALITDEGTQIDEYEERPVTTYTQRELKTLSDEERQLVIINLARIRRKAEAVLKTAKETSSSKKVRKFE